MSILYNRQSGKPSWLNKRIDLRQCNLTSNLLKDLNLNTVCQEALCPNIGECFPKRRATFLILGKICTRGCKFCAVKKGEPGAVDWGEPGRIAKAVAKLNLKHVVITSVTRDDLPDGGASVFSQTVLEIKKNLPQAKVEVLIPDFNLNEIAINALVAVNPDIIGHNIETVPSLYSKVRKNSDYERSLKVLKIIKKINPAIYTKSGIMLGLGETETEVLAVLEDLHKAHCDFISIGQYLAPSSKHYSIKEYIHPDQFKIYQEKAKEIGFLHVQSSAYTRSSYLAEEYLN